MGDPWLDEGFGGEDDWDEGTESIDTDLEEGFPDPDEDELEPWGEGLDEDE
jgi:hypothetical protein